MSILVQGMKMPKNCRTCPMLYDGYGYKWCNITGESLGFEETDNGRDKYCPLIEIKKHHGRLGDLDKLKRKAQKVSTEAWKMKLTAKIETTINQFIDWLDNAETIVEAE